MWAAYRPTDHCPVWVLAWFTTPLENAPFPDRSERHGGGYGTTDDRPSTTHPSGSPQYGAGRRRRGCRNNALTKTHYRVAAHGGASFCEAICRSQGAESIHIHSLAFYPVPIIWAAITVRSCHCPVISRPSNPIMIISAHPIQAATARQWPNAGWASQTLSQHWATVGSLRADLPALGHRAAGRAREVRWGYTVIGICLSMADIYRINGQLERQCVPGGYVHNLIT